MKKKPANFHNFNRFSGRIKITHRRKSALFLMLILLSLAALVPGGYFLGKYAETYYSNQNVTFNGNYLPTNLCKYGIFKSLPWCRIEEEPLQINMANAPIRDTRNEIYPEQKQGDKVLGAWSVLPGEKGEIRSNNLRFEFAYNQIVRLVLQAMQQINPSYAEGNVIQIQYYDTDNILDLSNPQPFDVAFTSVNEIGKIVNVKIDDNANIIDVPLPIILYNTSKFYERLLDFFNFWPNYNQYADPTLPASQNNQTNSNVLSYNGSNLIIPDRILTSLGSGDINAWLYKYWSLSFTYFVREHWSEFLTVNPGDSQVIPDSPFSNFILYAPSLIGLPDQAMEAQSKDFDQSALASVLYDAQKPNNTIIPVALRLTQNYLRNNNLNYYFLMLPPGEPLTFYSDKFRENPNLLVQLLTLGSGNANYTLVLTILNRYPFLKNMAFTPMLPLMQNISYNHKAAYTEAVTATLQVVQTAEKDITNAQNRLLYLARYWGAVNAMPATVQNVTTPADNRIEEVDVTSDDAQARNVLTLAPSVSTVELLKTTSITENGIVIDNFHEYIDLLAREAIFTLFNNTLSNFGTLATNISPLLDSFANFYNAFSQGEPQMQNPGSVFIKFLAKGHGIGPGDEEQNYGYFSPEEIANNIDSPGIIQNITAVNLYYTAATTNQKQQAGDQAYPIKQDGLTFSFTLNWRA